MFKNRLPITAAVMIVAAACLSAPDATAQGAPPVFFPPPPPVYNWTGLYLGMNAGYAFNNKHAFTTTANDPTSGALLTSGATPGRSSLESNGIAAGLGIGYNYEFLNVFGTPAGIVVGVEADAAYTDLNKTTPFVDSATGTQTVASSQLDYLGTGRGRLGVAYDKFLLFGTGGVAFGGLHDGRAIFSANGNQAYGGLRDPLKIGYAYGGGIEYLIPTGPFMELLKAASVTLKLEYLHYDLGQGSYQVTSTFGSSFTDRVRADGNVVRAGISYKFGPPVAPPMAPVSAKF